MHAVLELPLGPLVALVATLAVVALKATVPLALTLGLDHWLAVRPRALPRVALWRTLLVVLILLPIAQWFAPTWLMPCVRDGLFAPSALATSTAMGVEPVAQPVVAVTPTVLPALDYHGPLGSWWLLVGLTVALSVYLGGLVVMGLRLLVAIADLRLMCDACEPVRDDDWQRSLARWQRRLGEHRPVRLLQTAQLKTPASVGWLRPAILVPARIVRTADAADRDAILLHELTHVHRGDYPWQMLLRAVASLYWMHPLMWVAARRLSLVCEHACDESCVRQLGGARRYGETLLNVAAQFVRRGAAPTGVGLTRTTQISRRIDRLDDGLSPSAAAPWQAQLVVSLLATASLLTLGAGEPLPSPAALRNDARLTTTVPLVLETTAAQRAAQQAVRRLLFALQTGDEQAARELIALEDAESDDLLQAIAPTRGAESAQLWRLSELAFTDDVAGAVITTPVQRVGLVLTAQSPDAWRVVAVKTAPPIGSAGDVIAAWLAGDVNAD